MDGRNELNTLLELVTQGDELVVTRIDRLTQSIFGLQVTRKVYHSNARNNQSIHRLLAKNALFRCTGAFVKFETNPRREKQMEGIAKVKADGR